MKRIILTAMAAVLLVPAFAQVSLENEEASQRYSQRYDLLVSKLGPAGVGVENLLSNWEKVDPGNKKMLAAKYSYYFNKSRTTTVVPHEGKKYLGNAPVLTLTDTLGADVNYFEDAVYDDELFSEAIRNIDKAIKLFPLDLDIRMSKASSLIAYEKDSPDMALACLESLVDDYYSGPERPWKFDGEPVEKDFFAGAIQEFCYEFYNIGSPASYDAFKALSEKMLSKKPKATMFLSNVGSYYLVAKTDYKTALKYYGKVLKIAPGDYTAVKNCVIISRKLKDVKMEKKYLNMLVACTPDEREKQASKARLEAMK